MILHLGVIDVPYHLAPSPRQKKPRASTVTTGDVATYLEDRYHILEHFFQHHEADIAADCEQSLSGAIENFMAGAPPSNDPLAGATSAIEDRMKQFLSTQEIERIGFPGIPTQAARKGVSHRRKHPYAKKNPRRPSFIDTGLMQSSYKAWTE